MYSFETKMYSFLAVKHILVQLDVSGKPTLHEVSEDRFSGIFLVRLSNDFQKSYPKF